nr:hypothetical protein [Tanacetum cinerariifolium]
VWEIWWSEGASDPTTVTLLGTNGIMTPRLIFERLLPYARSLGFKLHYEGLSFKANVLVLHTAQLDVTVWKTILSLSKRK